MKTIDLHTHSNASDGSESPSDVIRAALKQNLSAVALTDHDTVSGILEARIAAEKYGIEFIPGIEVSAIYHTKDIHIVGLFVDESNPDFLKTLAHFRQLRDQRNEKIIEKINAAGIKVSLDEIKRKNGDSVITRANIARYLLSIGYVSSIADAFDRFLSPGKPFYVPKTGVTPEDAIHAILLSGGIPILAHPLSYSFSNRELLKCIETFKSYGLVGIEGYYSTFSDADTRYIKKIANTYDLLLSGGSDYHGTIKPHIQIGCGLGRLVISYDLLERLKAFHKRHS